MLLTDNYFAKQMTDDLLLSESSESEQSDSRCLRFLRGRLLSDMEDIDNGVEGGEGVVDSGGVSGAV